jgi:hypothetical protein
MKKIFLLAVLLIGSAAFAQTVVAKHPKGKTAPAKTAKPKEAKTAKAADAQTAYQPPVEVQGAFEDEFPSVKAAWRKDFGGANKDEPRFVADFTMQGSKVAAYYDKDGVQKVLMRSVPVSQIPDTAAKYLKTNYPTFTIVGAAKVKNENKTYTFEVGLTDKATFYDTVFDTSGNFLLIRKKDK